MPYKLPVKEKNRLMELFDIERYFACDKLDAAGWCYQLSRRLLVKERLETPPSELPETVFTANELILDVLHRPLKNGAMVGVLPFLGSAIEDAEGRHIFFYRMNVKNVIVDLRATDEKLTSDFKDWLAAKRKELRGDGISQPNYKKIGRNVQKEWYEYDVLAYIDLMLYGLVFKLKIPLPIIAELLFGNRTKPDPVDQVRKVIIPKAKKLFTRGTFEALAHESSRNLHRENSL